MDNDGDVRIHFTEHFGLDPETIDSFGAFNVSLVNDIPLFIDPFLLFNSEKSEYRALHNEMIRYLRFLRDRALSGAISPALVATWYTFPEFKQTWLGFSQAGNSGRGLGRGFAFSLHKNLNTVFSTFGDEHVTLGSHIEKLTLIESGIGKDKISDFTTNLIKEYLLKYTQTFAQSNLSHDQLGHFRVPKVRFNYQTESWASESFELPKFENDFVVLIPMDMLTMEDIWINKSDMISQFDQIVQALPNEQIRAQLNNYFISVLPDEPTAPEKRAAIFRTIRSNPDFIEYYIRFKEDSGDKAVAASAEKVAWSHNLFVDQARSLAFQLFRNTPFYSLRGDTHSEARQRVEYMKDVIENKGGWRVLYVDNEPVRREKDLHVLFRLTWFGTPSDVSTEVDDGRGPADFKISRGSRDKSIVEFKLASNSHLKRNLEKQTEVYMKASDAKVGIKVIVYFTKSEYDRVMRILDELKMRGDPNIYLIDARSDNKPSASKA